MDTPEIGMLGMHILQMFLELNGARQQGMNGPLPISYTELKAYSELTDTSLEPWEVDAIRLCDRIYLTENAKGKEN